MYNRLTGIEDNYHFYTGYDVIYIDLWYYYVLLDLWM